MYSRNIISTNSITYNDAGVYTFASVDVRGINGKFPIQSIRSDDRRPPSNSARCFIAAYRLDLVDLHESCYAIVATGLASFS